MPDEQGSNQGWWDQLRRLELSLLSAWPATDRHEHRGWVFTANGGHTDRANSAAAVDAAAEHEVIDEIEAWYRARGQTPMLRTTPLTPTGAIVEAQDRGYVVGAGSCHVMVRALLDRVDPPPEVQLSATPTEQWWSLTGRPRSQWRALAEMFATHGDDGVVASVAGADGPVAIGQGVVARGHLHVFAVHTLATHRGRGLASAVMDRLEAWGVDRGAEVATLQVTVDNAAAQSLYRRRTYHTVYRYDYLSPGTT